LGKGPAKESGLGLHNLAGLRHARYRLAFEDKTHGFDAGPLAKVVFRTTSSFTPNASITFMK